MSRFFMVQCVYSAYKSEDSLRLWLCY